MKHIRLRPKLRLDPYSLPDPRQKSSTSDYWVATAGLILVAFGSLLVGLLLYIDSHTGAQIPISHESWHVDFTPLSAGCHLDALVNDDCPASPNSASLWKSETMRGSKEFLDHLNKGDRLSYWIGTQVSADLLKRSAHELATTLILPHVHGDVDVWIDGVYQLRHSSKEQRLPLQINLPTERLLEGAELSIAMRVLPYPNYFDPDTSTSQDAEGFFTPIESDRISRYTVFFSLTRYLIATGLFLLLAGILWSVSFANRTSHDYVVGSQFALLIALNSLVSMDLSARVLNVSAFHSFYFLLLFWEAVFVTRLTLAILRVSRRLTLQQGLALLGISIGITALTPQTWIWSTGLSWMTAAFLPLVYGACSLALGARVWQLRKKSGPISRDRFEFLLLCSGNMAITAMAYAAEAFHTSGFDVSWSRWLNFATLYFLVRLFTRGHLAKVSLIESLPVSKYHRMQELPEKVTGWVLHLELLKFGTDHQVMHTVLSHLWSIVQLHDGEVIRTESNAIVALFEREADDSDSHALVQTLSDMAKSLRDLEKRFQIILPDGSFSASILFRAAVLRASVRPAWKTGETSSQPFWIEADGDVAGASAKALLEVDLDAALRSNDASIVVMNKDEAMELEARENIPPSARLDVPTEARILVFRAARMMSRRQIQTDRTARTA